MTNSTLTTAQAPDRWTRLNISLHWLIVVLLVVQYLIGEWMVDFFDAGIEGKAPHVATITLGYLHIVVGLTILAAAAFRLWDRFTHGRPAHSEREPNWAVMLAKVTHFSLYSLLLAMPIAGLIAWLLANEWLGDQHVLASNVLLGIIAVHVTGALTSHWWFKTDSIRNMMPGRGRSSGKA